LALFICLSLPEIPMPLDLPKAGRSVLKSVPEIYPHHRSDAISNTMAFANNSGKHWNYEWSLYASTLSYYLY
jgi:hypothetical protein